MHDILLFEGSYPTSVSSNGPMEISTLHKIKGVDGQ